MNDMTASDPLFPVLPTIECLNHFYRFWLIPSEDFFFFQKLEKMELTMKRTSVGQLPGNKTLLSRWWGGSVKIFVRTKNTQNRIAHQKSTFSTQLCDIFSRYINFRPSRTHAGSFEAGFWEKTVYTLRTYWETLHIFGPFLRTLRWRMFETWYKK